jgi:hypothetical protein
MSGEKFARCPFAQREGGLVRRTPDGDPGRGGSALTKLDLNQVLKFKLLKAFGEYQGGPRR